MYKNINPLKVQGEKIPQLNFITKQKTFREREHIKNLKYF